MSDVLEEQEGKASIDGGTFTNLGFANDTDAVSEGGAVGMKNLKNLHKLYNGKVKCR